MPLDSQLTTVQAFRAEAVRGRLYAVVDACDAPDVLGKVAELGESLAVSLYRSPAAEDLAAIAPYLLRVGGATFDWIVATRWADPWGIFAVADADLGTLRTHFRKFLLVDAPDGASWYFRFYDPRVLPKFLASAQRSDLVEFFGPIRLLGHTDPASYGIMTYLPPPPVIKLLNRIRLTTSGAPSA